MVVGQHLQHPEQAARLVAGGEHDRGARRIGRRGVVVARQDHEAGVVPAVGFDSFRQYRHAVLARGRRPGQRGLGRVAGARHLGHGAGGVVERHLLPLRKAGQELSALGEPLRVRVHPADAGGGGPRHADQAPHDAGRNLAYDADVGKLQQQVVVLVDRTGERVLDRQQPVIHRTVQYLAEHVPELPARHRLRVGEVAVDGVLAVGAAFALKCHRHRRGMVRRRPAPACGARQPQHFLAQHRRQPLHVAHQLLELGGIQRLGAVRKRRFGIGVHFHQNPVGAGRHRGEGHRPDLVAHAGTVAGIDEDRQVTELLDHRDGGQIESVAGIGLEGANAALAQNHRVGAVRQQVFGGHQEVFDGGRQTALEQHRLADLSDPLEELEVLHVARAHLEHVQALGRGRQMLGRHHLRDDRQPVTLAGLLQQLDPRLAQTLKRVGRRARLEGPAAQPHRPRLLEHGRHFEDLVARFHRAGAGDYRQAATSHLDRSDRDHGLLALELTRGEFVGLAERNDLGYSGQQLHLALIERVAAHRSEERLAVLAQLADLVAMRREMFAHRALLAFGDAAVEDDNHG